MSTTPTPNSVVYIRADGVPCDEVTAPGTPENYLNIVSRDDFWEPIQPATGIPTIQSGGASLFGLSPSDYLDGSATESDIVGAFGGIPLEQIVSPVGRFIVDGYSQWPAGVQITFSVSVKQIDSSSATTVLNSLPMNGSIQAILFPWTDAQGAYTAYIGIDCGGTGAGTFVADEYSTGGSTFSVSNAIDTGSVLNSPAPQEVYQTERFGTFLYNIATGSPNTACHVRLHFSENYHTATGQRVFNVSSGGTSILSGFDIYEVAGAQFKATVSEFDGISDGTGILNIQFDSITDNAKIDGIEVFINPPPPEFQARWRKAIGYAILDRQTFSISALKPTYIASGSGFGLGPGGTVFDGWDGHGPYTGTFDAVPLVNIEVIFIPPTNTTYNNINNGIDGFVFMLNGSAGGVIVNAQVGLFCIQNVSSGLAVSGDNGATYFWASQVPIPGSVGNLYYMTGGTTSTGDIGGAGVGGSVGGGAMEVPDAFDGAIKPFYPPFGGFGLVQPQFTTITQSNTSTGYLGGTYTATTDPAFNAGIYADEFNQYALGTFVIFPICDSCDIVAAANASLYLTQAEQLKLFCGQFTVDPVTPDTCKPFGQTIGSSGTFGPLPFDGRATFTFNDTQGQFGNNHGQFGFNWSDGVTTTSYTIPANVAGPLVLTINSGVTYTYNASGTCYYSPTSPAIGPDGNGSTDSYAQYTYAPASPFGALVALVECKPDFDTCRVTPDIFAAGTSYFGMNVPSGTYTIRCPSGALDWTGGGTQYSVSFDTNTYYAISYSGGVALWPYSPIESTDIAAQADQAGVSVVINHIGPAPIGVFLQDSPYSDNLPGPTTGAPTFSISPCV